MTHNTYFGFLIFLLLLFVIYGCNDSPTDANDDPDLDDVITITTIEELQMIGNEPDFPIDHDYELGNDIDASDTENWNDGAGFEPIYDEDEDNQFRGDFNGNGHTITGLYISEPDSGYVGLFRRTFTGEIRDLTLDEVYIEGERSVGALSGYISGTHVENVNIQGHINGHRHSTAMVSGQGTSGGAVLHDVHVEGTIDAGNGVHFGGLVGTNNGEITSSSADVEIEAPFATSNIGGLAGGMNRDEAIISESYATGIINTSSRSVGGLTGELQGTITNSFADVDLTGRYELGGLVGRTRLSDEITIENSYAHGDVHGEEPEVGGIVGLLRDEAFGEMKNVYTAGFVSSDDENKTGAIVGHNKSDVEVAVTYWDHNTQSQFSDAVGEGHSWESYQSFDTEQMQGDAAEENMSDLDFEDTWQTVSGDYPELWWE